MNPPQLSLAYFCRDGSAFHIARAQMRGAYPCQLHTHDFAEVFWVENGSGIHLINNNRQPLSRGSLVLMRPNDCHGFRNSPGLTGFTVVNVAFPHSTLDFLHQRYFPNSTNLFWSTAGLPYTVHLTAAQLSWLHGWAGLLARDRSNQMTIDRFLLELLTELRTQPPSENNAPAWLHQAMAAVRESKHWNQGTPAFAKLAGRSPQHVNRALQQYYGLTTTDVVNRARMDHAATELMMGTKKIIEICLECGFQNLGHFYKVFRQYYGTTPRLYRQRQRALLP